MNKVKNHHIGLHIKKKGLDFQILQRRERNINFYDMYNL